MIIFVMDSGWQLNGMLLGGTALLAGGLFCVLFFRRRQQISDQVSMPLSGALLSVMVGCQLMNIWLGVNFRTEFCSNGDYAAWNERLFALLPFRVLIYLFSAVIGHFLILATGRLIQEHRQRVLTRATAICWISAVTAITATILMTWTLWHQPILKAREAGEAQWKESQELTEHYLTEWLKEEPESPEAQQLYRAFQEDRRPETHSP